MGDASLSSTCEHCGSDGALRYRQSTKYADESRNWITLCGECRVENDARIADRRCEFEFDRL